MGVTKIRFPETSGIGIKPVSKEGTARIVRAAINHAISEDKSSVTLVHKGNIMKFTEGGFRDWGYQIAREEFGAKRRLDGGPWCVLGDPETGNQITIKDVIADAMLQQALTRPREYSVLTTMNLNGDTSDASRSTGGRHRNRARCEYKLRFWNCDIRGHTWNCAQIHGSEQGQPRLTDPLKPEMMLRHMGWGDAADLIVKGMEGAISAKTVTYDFERLMEGATLLSCSEFGEAITSHM